MTTYPASLAGWLGLLHAETRLVSTALDGWGLAVWESWAAWRSQVAAGGHPIAACIPVEIVPEVALHYRMPCMDAAPCIGVVEDSPAEWTMLSQKIAGLELAAHEDAPGVEQVREALSCAHAAQPASVMSLALYPAGGVGDGVIAYIDTLTITGTISREVAGLLGDSSETVAKGDAAPAHTWRWV